MSNVLAKYSFLPWVRRGIANQISGTSVDGRAQVDVQVVVNQTLTVDKNILLVGPGDIVGIDNRAILKTEPRNWITNFEPNYLAHIEFYDEDFIWRYTPQQPDTNLHRLPPWVFLLVLKENEFSIDNIPGNPLSVLKLKTSFANVLPDPSETWAWGIVHLNEELNDSGTQPNLDELNNILDNQPDTGICRLICPRRLHPLTNYHAFLIPAFESGRQAGLGRDVKVADPLLSSWGAKNTNKEFPVYYTWYFKTSDKGDFEYLVSLLEPRPIPDKVGIRDMDIQRPGFGIDSIVKPAFVGLEGALLPPVPHHIDLGGSLEFPEKLQPIINLSDDLQKTGSPDPVVTPPLYGRWPARISRMDYTVDNWIQDLNKDPRFRAAGGMGTIVVQKFENIYLQKAWQQVGTVIAANQKIKYLQWAMNASLAIYTKYLVNVEPERHLMITQSVHSKILGSPTTIRNLVNNSQLPRAALSGSFRKLTRPRGVMMKRFFGNAGFSPGDIITKLNNGDITAAAPKQPPKNLPTVDQVSGQVESATPVPAWLLWLTGHKKLLLILLIILLVVALIFLLIGHVAAAISVASFAVAAYVYLINLKPQQAIETGFTTAGLTTQAVLSVAPRPNFTIVDPGVLPAQPVIAGGADNAVAANFRNSLVNFNTLLQQSVPVPATLQPLNIASVQLTLNQALHPYTAFNKRFVSLIKIGNIPIEAIAPIMAYPDIKDPMYKPLTDISKEYFVPNLKLIAPNTITIMITNQPFIESYMVGLNHQMAKALLWNEYPTDQMGTYFRQFWDTSKYVDTENLPPDQLAEKLRDIKPIHTWQPNSKLGDHNNRQPVGNSPQLVLVIRGELLKRYPNAIIYAQQAIWGKDKNNQTVLMIDETIVLDTDNPAMLFPLYNAEVDPDIFFIGFELTVAEAQGEVTEESDAEKAKLGNNNLGWFFVIKEMPGEPKFGLDETIDLNTAHRSLSWQDFDPATKVLDVNINQDTVTTPKKWDSSTNGADVSYITYRQPVLVAVHAKEMLKSL
jgi:hypothetical protein